MTTLRHGAYWTEGEVSALLKAIKTNVPMYEIANIHGRTNGAISSMLRKIASTYHFRDKLPISQIQEVTGLSEKTVNTVISEGPRVGKTEYIKRMKPIISQTMEFPITKDRLQNFGNEFSAICKKKVVDELVESWSTQIIEKAGMESNTIKQYLSEKAIRTSNQLCIYIEKLELENPRYGHNLIYYTDDAFSKLKERFPDIAICIDPLQTYILFDWN